MRQPTVDEDWTELLEREGQEDTPMNRAMARQTINKRRKEEEKERSRREMQANSVHEDSALNVHEKRLAQRRAGGANRDTTANAGASTVRRHNRSAAISATVEPLAIVNDELFSAPKPAEGKHAGALKANQAAGSYNSSGSYFNFEDDDLASSPIVHRTLVWLHKPKRSHKSVPASVPSSRQSCARPRHENKPFDEASDDHDSTPHSAYSENDVKTNRDEDEEEDLPEGWQRVHDPNGNPYYYHHISRLSRWEKPSKEVAAQHERRLNESMAREAEAVSQRREERRREEEKLRKEVDAKDAV